MFAGARAKRSREAAARLYERIVAQSRRVAFYRECAVPDTLDGRFDMLVLHMALVLRRLKAEPGGERRLAQDLFDRMFADMDESLREMGVSDMSVGKRVKQMGAAFYGRLAAYDTALAAAGGALEEALARNVYRGEAPACGGHRRLAAWARAADRTLASRPAEEIRAGDPRFGEP